MGAIVASEGLGGDVVTDYERRLLALNALGLAPYPCAKNLSDLLQRGGVIGRILKIDPGRMTLAYPDAASAREFVVASSLSRVVAELRRGDLVVASFSDGTVDGITPAVIAKRPLEEKDTDPGVARVRQREQELFWSAITRRTFVDSERVVTFLRRYLRDRGFLEVGMPVLTSNPDISPNMPFRTQAADGTVLCLRTTYPYSERLMYSLEKVYQIGPNFRDEPSGVERSPEFNMLSIGQAMVDYEQTMDFGELLVKELAKEVTGGSTQLRFMSEYVDFALPWTRLSTGDAVARFAEVDINDCFDLARLEQIVTAKSLPLPQTPFSSQRGQIYHGAVFDVLLKTLVYPKLRQPTFLTEFPYFFGGPGRAVDSAGRFKMRAEGFVAGIEIAETASVLTDPREIRRWHSNVLEEKKQIGWIQDEDGLYLDTVDRGLMVPSVIAFGIERLLMLVLQKQNINEVMWYSHQM